MKSLKRYSRVVALVLLVLALSMVTVQGIADYPVVVSIDGVETVFIATHTDYLAGGNWIYLSGGTSVRLPSLTLAYSGLESATYIRDGVRVKIDSSFATGEATYPISTHQVFTSGDSITAKFYGESALEGTSVDFRLIRISSLTEAKDIFTGVFQGDLTTLQDSLFRAWSRTETVVDGVATATIPSSLGNYLLVVVNENFDPHYELKIYSATVIEVLSKTLSVSSSSSVEKGETLNVDTGEGGVSVAVLIKESAYKAEITIMSDNSVLGTELYLNDVLMADGGYVIDNMPSDIWDMIPIAGHLIGQLDSAFGSNEMSLQFNLFDGTLSLPTRSLSTGKYVLLAGVVKTNPIRIVGVSEQTVRVIAPDEPTPRPSNKSPVADAGPDMKALVNRTVRFDGSGSSDPDGRIMSWTWSFGDGETASGEAVSHKYSEDGTYYATLTVKDNRGASRSDTCTVTISVPPAPIIDEVEELIPGGEVDYVVDALAETNTTVTLNTTDTVTVTVIKYDENPHPDDPLPATALPYYVDVEVSNPDAVSWPIYVQMHYNDDDLGDLDESTLGIYYWMDGAWQRCSHTGVDMERNIVWAYMTAMEASGSPIMIAGLEKIITPPLLPFLDNLVITPEEVELGEDVTIRFDIMNPNNQSITHYSRIKVGEISQLVYVELDAYESKTVTRTLTTLVEGIIDVIVDGLTGNFTVIVSPIPPTLAEFVVSDLTVLPTEIEEGWTVMISVTVTNIGESEGSYTIEFKVDGETVESETVTILGDSVYYSIFEKTWSAGSYEVSVEDLSVDFTVSEPEPDQFNWLLIVLAGVAVALIGYFVYRRRQQTPS